MSNTDDRKIEFMKLYSANPSKYEAEKPAKDILSLSIKTFSPKIAFASSFGAEDVVIIDLMYNIHGDEYSSFYSRYG